MNWIKKKQETPQKDELWDKLMKILQVIEVNQTKLEHEIDNIKVKIKGFDLKYSKLLKQITAEEEEKQEAPKSEDYLNHNILGLR